MKYKPLLCYKPCRIRDLFRHFNIKTFIIDMKLQKLNCFRRDYVSSSADTVNDKEENIGRTYRTKGYFIQFMSILPGYILMTDIGAVTAWSSPALPHLTSEKSEFPVSVAEGAWLTSSINISALIGSTFFPLIMNRIGRKYTLLLLSVIQLMSWILVNISYNYTFLLIARLVTGLCIGGTYAILPIYIGEISEKNIRGSLLSLEKIFLSIGIFFINALGAFLPYNTMNLIMICVPITAMCMFPLMSETPYFQLMKGQDEEATDTLTKLSGGMNQEMVIEDIKRMKEAIIESQKSTNCSFGELFRHRGSRRAFMVISLAEITSIFSGQIIIQSYTQEIFSNSGSSLSPGYAAMIMTGVQVFTGLPASRLSDKWGRRPVYLFSGLATALALGTVGLFFFLKTFLETDVSNVTWLPLVSLVLYQFTCNSGISTMPFIYSGELLSLKVKGAAIISISFIASVFIFSVKMLVPWLNCTAGIYVSFWIFSTACIIGPIIIFIIAPETKGKNLEEVLDLMSSKKDLTNIQG